MRRNCLVSDKQYDSYYASRVAAACEPFVREAGVDIVSCISCGVEGCVYKLSDPKLVAKFTGSENEAIIAGWLMEQKRVPPVLPIIEGVWEIDKCNPYKGFNGYLILREDLSDLKVDSYSDFKDALHYFVDKLKVLLVSKTSKREFISLLDEVSQELGKHDRKHFKQVTDALDFFIKHEFVPADLHPDNMGLRKPDQAVIRDLGLSSYSIPRVELETM